MHAKRISLTDSNWVLVLQVYKKYYGNMKQAERESVFSYTLDSSNEYLGRKLQQEAANNESPPPILVRQMEEKIKKTETFKICKYI